MCARQKFKTLRDGFMIFKIKVRLIANLNDRVIFLRILSCNFIITCLNYIIKTFLYEDIRYFGGLLMWPLRYGIKWTIAHQTAINRDREREIRRKLLMMLFTAAHKYVNLIDIICNIETNGSDSAVVYCPPLCIVPFSLFEFYSLGIIVNFLGYRHVGRSCNL